MNFELSKDIVQWCQEALSEIDGTPVTPFEKVQAAIQVHQLKVLFDITQKLSQISEGLVAPDRQPGSPKIAKGSKASARRGPVRISAA